ncbi:MAG: hypothetical protein U9R08_03640 [Nanoarchaeota archaeon]|nr:hypothetical protein [Nanoarchaeota archaeon]
MKHKIDPKTLMFYNCTIIEPLMARGLYIQEVTIGEDKNSKL